MPLSARNGGAARTSAVSAGTRSSLASGLLSATADGLGPDALQRDLAAVTRTTEAEIDAALAGISLSNALVIVVGDLSVIREEVEAAVPATWQVIAP